MSTPVIESIAQYLVTVVDGITTAAGYNYTLTAVRPRCLTLDQDLAQDKNVIITQGDPVQPEIVQGNIRQWEQPFYLAAIVYEDASEAVDTKINKIRSDIEKAIGVANATHVAGKRANGKADYIQLNEPRYLEYDQFTGILVAVTVGYSVAANDPYTVK